MNSKKDRLATDSSKKAAAQLKSETARKDSIAAKNAAKISVKAEEEKVETETPAAETPSTEEQA